MKWIGERISFIDEKTRTTIVIYPKAKPIIKGLMGAWVSMWFVIGVTMSWSFFSLQLNQQEKLIVGIFMVFWTYYAFRVFRSFFWLMWGKELIKIDEVAFHYKKSIRSYGRSVPYYLENVKKMELFIPKEKSFQAVFEDSPWVSGGERIVFDYLGKPVRFARKLDEKESKLLFQLVTKKVEERIKKNK